MTKWTMAPPLIDEESGEPLFGGYEPWFLKPGMKLAITKSQYLVFKANAELCARGEITPAQAQLNEANFIFNGWDWIDDPKKQARKRTYQKMLMEAMLLKGEEEDEDEE